MISSVLLQFCRDLLLAPTEMVPIPKGELRVIITDPHNKKEKGLITILSPEGEIMWVLPDLIESQQWTTVTNRKSKRKGKAPSCNVVYTFSREAETNVASLTNLEKKEIVLAA